MIQTAEAPPAAAEVVLSRQEASEVLAAHDLPLLLVKGPRREEALARGAVFFTSALTVVRPAQGPDHYRWTYQGFVQRQVCMTSITGLFACSEPQAERLPDAETGEAPLPAEPDSYPLADGARARLIAGLKTRATAILAADRKANLDPLLKASGVVKAAPPRPGGPAARGGRAAGGGSGARR